MKHYMESGVICGFRGIRVSQNQGFLLGSPYNQESSIFGPLMYGNLQVWGRLKILGTRLMENKMPTRKD